MKRSSQSYSAERAEMHPITAKSDVQPRVPEELLELRGILEESWSAIRPSGLVCEVAPAATEGGGGEDGQGEGLGLYDLSTAPEHVRPHLEPILKEIEGKANEKFREHADFRKQWEPFGAIEGLSELAPEDLTELVEFRRDVIADPEKFEEWWRELGQEAGWLDGAGVSAGDDDDDDDVPPQVAALQSQLENLSGQVQQLLEGHTQREESDRTNAAKEAITAELDKLVTSHKEAYDEELDRDAVVTFAFRYPNDSEAIQKGYKDLLKLTGKAQGDLVDDKLGQPSAATTGGRPGTEAEPPKTFREAKEAARARARATVGST